MAHELGSMNLADRKELRGAVQNESPMGRREREQSGKKQSGSGKVTSLLGMAGVRQADSPPSAD